MSGLRLHHGQAAVSGSRTTLESSDVRGRESRQEVSPPGDSFHAAPKKVLRTLRRGATGSQVRGLQAKLQLLGLMTARDVKSGPGVFGPRTEAAVARFQQRLGYPPTGVADPGTRAALMGADKENTETTAPAGPSKTLTDDDELGSDAPPTDVR